MHHSQDVLRHRKYINKITSFPTTSIRIDTTSDMPSDCQRIRKRRRGEVANPANTLDGLVAKRADDIGARDSLYKRYLTEAEAIEAPTDDQEMKRIETDPDVSTRTCSVCGYQGKWVSEMIRHKRVHTNERPFRCKYCSRTSKWKADLIRHVAKTHGIRVVSKYSRSKAFDNSAVALNLANCRTESKGKNKPSVKEFTDLKNDEGAPMECKKPKSSRLPIMYRCVICLFEQDSVLILMSHLKNVHNTLPYECHSCGSLFMDAHTTMKHFTERTTCTKADLKINIAPLYAVKNDFNSKPSFALLDEAAKRAAHELFNKGSVITSLPASSITSSPNAVQKVLPDTLIENNEGKQREMYASHGVDAENRQGYKDASPEMACNSIFSNWCTKKLCTVHTENQPLSQRGGLLKPTESKTICSKAGADVTAAAQALTSKCFDFGSVLSVLKKQVAFDPLLSLQALASMATPLPGWVPAGPSAFSQMSPVSAEVPPVASFTPYSKIQEIRQEKNMQRFSTLLVDTSNNMSCHPTAIISSFSPSTPRNFHFSNSASYGTSLDQQNSIGTNPSASDSTSPGRYSSEDVIKASEHYYQRRNALCSAFTTLTDKIQELKKDHPGPSDDKINRQEANDERKEDDDFVDVVQLDE